MKRFARGAIALLVLIAWALPCHDVEARRSLARAHASGAGTTRAPRAEKPHATAAATDSMEVRRFVDDGNSDFIRAWMTGDADLFAGCFAADGALLHPGRPAVVGRDRIRERMKAVFSKYRMAAGAISTIDLYVLGDTAYETGKWKFDIGPIGGSAEPDSGRYIEVWKREGKAWKMWRDISVPE
jgi:uncharacterized protein (TIGR02246 family)